MFIFGSTPILVISDLIIKQLRIICYLFHCCLLTISVSAQDSTRLAADGALQFKVGNYKAAISLFSRAIEIAPQNAGYLVQRGRTYFSLEQYETGFIDISKAIQLDPEYDIAYFERGYFFYKISSYDKSILDYTSAIDFAKTDSLLRMSYVNRASSHMRKREFSAAISDCRTVLVKDSNDIGALNNLAMAMEGSGKHEEAIQIFQKILAIDSTIGYVNMNIGFIKLKSEQWSAAIDYFNKSIIIDPSNPLTYNNRGFAKYKLADFSGAMDDINKSLKMFPSNSYAYRNRGLVFQALGKKDKACTDWNKARGFNFTEEYGNEINELLKNNCY